MIPRMLKIGLCLFVAAFALLLAGCGGAPANNPNYSTPSTGDTEIVVVDDGIMVLSYVSASPDKIGLKGQGGTESSIVSFKVTDTADSPLSGVQVSFSLDTSVGGIVLRGSTLVRSDSDGLAAITVVSGTVSTVAHVVAKLYGNDVSSISEDITISTGIPVYGRLAAGGEQNEPKTLGFVGTEVELTVVASDQFGNYAFDGTRVSLWSPYAGAVDSSCTLIDGRCSATWVSAAGADAPIVSVVSTAVGDLTYVMAPILVYASGAESFKDENGNNMYDSGEVFADLGEAFLDVNRSGNFDADEFFVDKNKNGLRDEGNGVYDGPCLTDNCEGGAAVYVWTELWLSLCPEEVEGMGLPCEKN